MSSAIPTDVSAVIAALSRPRFDTYVTACDGDPQRAVALYGWNARVSAAFMLPAHFAEVVIRNAVDDALVSVYGAAWPWSKVFVRSLPTPARGFKPREDVLRCVKSQSTTGKVIAELSFVFWQRMFTARHDGRLWDGAIATLFPAAPNELTTGQLRERVYNDLEAVRRLRNRIAHHEPVFTRDLRRDLDRVLDLIEMRSPDVAHWTRAMEDVTAVLSDRP